VRARFVLLYRPVAYRDLWSAIGLPWLGNVMAAMLALGAPGQAAGYRCRTFHGTLGGRESWLPSAHSAKDELTRDTGLDPSVAGWAR
jgi:hypothetical protein